MKISLNVLDKILPPPAEWKFDLDLWQHAVAIARINKVALWSKIHFDKMRPYYSMLAAAVQKCITASIINEPWGHQTFDDFPSLIKWIKKKDGTWVYDYSLFDRYISFVRSCRINNRINCYTMIPWKLSFQYYDESFMKDTVLNAKPGSVEYNAHWGVMLKDFTKHLKEKKGENLPLSILVVQKLIPMALLFLPRQNRFGWVGMPQLKVLRVICAGPITAGQKIP
nr:glycoside hydrolase domain-containing protein [Ferruginibacter sp.]